MVGMTIRPARSDELERLRDIEWAAGTLFLDTPFAAVAEHEPVTTDALAQYVADDRAWVATADNDDDNNNNDTPVGYAIVDVIDGHAHLEQLSVDPEHGRKGLGAALLEQVCAWAVQHDYPAVSLSTFKAIPWNAPFYACHGFTTMTADEIGPGLQQLAANEKAIGLDPDDRVFMQRRLNAN